MVQSGDSRLMICEDFLGGSEVAVASTTKTGSNDFITVNVGV